MIHHRDAEHAERSKAMIADALAEDYVDDPVTREVIGAAITVHQALGPGLLESAYQTCLAHEIRKRGFRAETEVHLPVSYDGMKLDCGYRLDIVVGDAVIVEVKAVESVMSVHLAQLLTYLRLAGKSRGLLLNFNVTLLKNGIYRRVLTPTKSSFPSAISATLR